MVLAESDRFILEDEEDGWLKLERRGADAMSFRERELQELLATLTALLERT